MIKQLWVSVVALGLLAGCGTTVAGSARVTSKLAAKADPVLEQDVRTGFQQIFQTYDRDPQDQKLSFREFGHVVTRDWFTQHDTNRDGFITLAEWLTPGELASQVADIQASGSDLVAKGDKDHDHVLSLPEFLAYDAFEVDPTPWLAGPADPDIKTHAFQQHAANGTLTAAQAALLMGDLLARGYYLDDGTSRLRP